MAGFPPIRLRSGQALRGNDKLMRGNDKLMRGNDILAVFLFASPFKRQ
jgi:hypothetical protein